MTNDDPSPDEQSEFPLPVWSRGEPNIAGATHRGVVRKINQDAFGRIDDPDRAEILLIVADGLGGHRGGEVASRMAVEQIGADFLAAAGEAPARLGLAIRQANDAILAESRKNHTLDGMGTTIVGLLLTEEGETWVAHVGDSRLYRMRGGGIKQLTEDHSLVATLVREGALAPEDARDDPRKNQILRALGVREDVEIDVAPVETRPGDRFLLCSDGLHGMIDDDAIEALVRSVARPETAVEKLIEAANDAGGTDNVTCLLAAMPEPPPTEGLREKAMRLFESTRAVFIPRTDGD